MKEDKIKISLLIPKEILQKIDEGKEKEFLYTRTLYINQVLRKHFGMGNTFERKNGNTN